MAKEKAPTAGGVEGRMNFSERERAKYHLNRRRGGGGRPEAEPQTEALFDEPGHRRRQLVPLPADETLFPEPGRAVRRLVGIDGWPDYAAEAGDG
jgi:hypothetical protein